MEVRGEEAGQRHWCASHAENMASSAAEGLCLILGLFEGDAPPSRGLLGNLSVFRT